MNIRHGRQSTPRRIMLYGTNGIGKSTWASMAPAPIFIPTEDGLADIDCHSFDLCQSFDDVLRALSWLYEQPHDYQTVVIDSADWLESLIWAEVCRKKGVETIADIGYGKGYAFALAPWRQVLDGLDALVRERGLTIILLAHARIERFNNPETDSYDRYTPRLHESSSHVLREWCSEVLFANYKVFTAATEEGFGRKTVKGVGGADRVLYTCERPSHVAKNRLNLPAELPLDWRSFAEHSTTGGAQLV